MRIKALTRLAITAVAGSVVLGVGTASAATAPTSKNPSTLSASFTMAANLALKPGFDALHARFNRLYPNVKMTPTYYSTSGSSPFATVISTQISGGNPPDVIWVLPGQAATTSALPLARGGFLAPQDSQSWVKDMYGPIKPNYTVKGKVYANELSVTSLSLVMYNKTYFAQNNLKVPKTWSEMLNLCRTIAAKGQIPVTWGGASPPVNALNTLVLAYNTVFSKDPKWFEKRLRGQVRFATTPGWRQALEQVVDAQKAGCMKRGFEGTALVDMATEFGSGRAAMSWTNPVQLAAVLAANPGMKVGMFPPPGPKAADTRLVLHGAGGLALSVKASGATKEAAQAWINYVYGETQSRLFARVGALLSSFDAKASKFPAPWSEMKTYFTQNKALPTVSVRFPNTRFQDTMGNLVQGLFTGQRTIDQVLAEMDRAFNPA